MGNVHSDPNRVDIMQNGCGGNIGWLCAGSEMFPRYMDGRLAPYLTEDDYRSVIDDVSTGMAQERKRCCSICGVVLLSMAVLSMLTRAFQSQYVPAYEVCAAPSGECSAEHAGAASDCCNWWCCDDVPAVSSLDYSQSCNRVPATNDSECGCRQVENTPLTTGTPTLPPDITTTSASIPTAPSQLQPARTLRSASYTVICGEVQIEGETTVIPDKNAWAAAVAMVLMTLHTVCCCGGLGNFMFTQCQISSKVQPLFEPWARKGLSARYHPGRKRFHPRIIVQLPHPVPPGASAGTPMQATAPNGQASQVPWSAYHVHPGGTFPMQY